MAQNQNQIVPFKPGERIAMPYLPVIKVENDVAVLAKKRLSVWAECGARHKVRVETPFYVRGGFRVFRTTKYEVPRYAFRVKFRTPYDSLLTEEVPVRSVYLDEEPNARELAETIVKEMFGSKVAEIVSVEVEEQVRPISVYVRKFKYAEVWLTPDGNILEIKKKYEGNSYFVYEFVNDSEAKLVDDDRADYVLHIFSHDQNSRVGCAVIRIVGGDIVWSDVKSACCRIASSAVAMIIARYGSKVTVARNILPYRGCCEEWEIEEWLAELPPRRLSQYSTTEPVATSISPEEVV